MKKLVSSRVKAILSNTKDSKKLANAIRKQRNGETDTAFRLSEETQRRIDNEKNFKSPTK